ncbi:hypothetical protein [Clostridium sp. VAP41]|uniref:hypothetical protein n=1 Tax=Clostridium sp. VAP41 TaxID=2949979 RepID=UPI0020794AFD|nr:hypothetical protein [Clostridium sp. VAP41]
MKKLILMAVATTLVLSLVACSGEAKNSKDSKLTSDSSQSENQEKTSIKTYMGQVSDKVGNDITLSIGKFVVNNDSGTDETFIYDGTGDPKPYDGDINDSGDGNMIMIPGPEDENVENNENASGGSSNEKLPIEFTGEVKEFTIPAGVKITNTAGKEAKLDTVVNGSLVQIIVNESTGIPESIMVW